MVQSIPHHKRLAHAYVMQVGLPHLPEDINRADSHALAGAHVLQVVAADNVAQPSKHGSRGSGAGGRLLRLKLTDGKTTCTALELHPTPCLDGDLPPGTKVCLKNAPVRAGLVMLDPKCTKVGRRFVHLADHEVSQIKHALRSMF